jgi:transposase
MKPRRKSYSKAFKVETVRLYESSEKSAAEIERELDLPGGIVHKWRYRMKSGEGEQVFVGKGKRGELEAENQRLRRELEVARQERDILKAAVVFFSKEKG